MEKKEFIELKKAINKLGSTEKGRKELLTNPKKALKDAGIKFPENIEIECLENTENTSHLVIPHQKLPKELCIKKLPSKPSLEQILLWVITEVQANSPLKERLLHEAEKVLQEQNISLPKNLKIKVLQNTEKKMFFVISKKSNGDEELSENDLQSVTGGISYESGFANAGGSENPPDSSKNGSGSNKLEDEANKFHIDF